ncbi:MDR family MFS transporter [Fructilactobacillus florum]|uniref:Major facilitator superfamily (MFS) profile domain-containing protein n=1 Tax=Fructilactobacillus florum DSM 22689 = JCM 16035 TaxID=1423745 RepID=A0A0R2CJ40_9LACO|nr:MDR family MFS transporter [Fructilactobacillus florum]KRM91365.1 hypothetical protein FC87_GL000876 [Fructilactobacillus florum DSM 22689 = JCM 16035]
MQARTNIKITTIALFIATFMTAVEGTIVSTAMPTIVGDLHGVSLMNWVFSIFLLTNAITTPIYGKLADQLGRKKIFLAGVVVFIIGSLFSGLSNSMETLIFWRALQGIGAGVIMPVSFTIVADMYPFEKRAQVIGILGSAWGIASIIGPLLGGFIVDSLSWHWIFFINVPIGLLTIVLLACFFYEQPHKKTQPLDVAGIIWLGIFLLALMVGFQQLSSQPINYLVLGSFLCVTILSGLAFYLQERHASDPIIPIDLFHNRTFVIQNCIAALISGFIFGYEVYLSDWTQGIMGLKATFAGFAVTPTSILWMVGSFWSGKLLLKWRPQLVTGLSLIFIGFGAVSLALLPITTPLVIFWVLSTIMGIGFGLCITTSSVTSQNEVSNERIGVASSFNTLSRTLGQTLMISVFGIVLNQGMANGIKQHPQASLKLMDQLINPRTATTLPASVLPTLRQILYGALHNVFLVALLLVIAAVIVNFFDRKQIN